MKKNIFIGCTQVKDERSDRPYYGGILETAYDFKTLRKNVEEIEESDFTSYSATNWAGYDEITRTLELKHLTPTGKKIVLDKPLRFKGKDDDMGHVYPWEVSLNEIWEVKENK